MVAGSILNCWFTDSFHQLLFVPKGKYAEAELLYENLQAIQEKDTGPGLVQLAATMNTRASLLQQQVGIGK